MSSSRSSKESTQTSKVTTVAAASTNNAPPTNDANSAAAACNRLIKIDNIQPPIVATSPVDINNNNTNNNAVVSSSAEAVSTTQLTTTFSETGPHLKVVVSPERGPVELLHPDAGATIVYTDASLTKNGNAGIGCYFGKNHPLNASQPLPGKHKSVGWAEIIAATVALQKLRGWSGYKKTPVILRTDHLMIVEAMQMDRIPPHSKFFTELQTLKKIAQDFPQGVQFEHVYAHNGDEGNEQADALATMATSGDGKPSPRRTRSKPPSRRMSRRTRSAYIRRSAPPEVHGLGKKDILKKPPKENDVALTRLSATQPYIPPPNAVALRDIKQMEMGVEKTQSEKSSRNKSVTGSIPSVEIIGVKEVRDETVKVDATQSLSQKSHQSTAEARTPRAKTPASRFVSRFSKPSINRTPSRSKDQPQLHNGRPITWAPKKSQATRSQKFSAAKSDGYNENEKQKIAAAEKMYTAEAAGHKIMAALEEFQENEDKQAELRSDLRQRCSSSRKAKKEVDPKEEKTKNNAAPVAAPETPKKRSERFPKKSQRSQRSQKKSQKKRSRKSKNGGRRNSRH